MAVAPSIRMSRRVKRVVAAASGVACSGALRTTGTAADALTVDGAGNAVVNLGAGATFSTANGDYLQLNSAGTTTVNTAATLGNNPNGYAVVATGGPVVLNNSGSLTSDILLSGGADVVNNSGSFVVGGWRPQTGTADRLASLLVGEQTVDGLLYRGRVGSGIAGLTSRRLADLLAPLASDTNPFADDVPRVDADGTFWVEPRVVVDVDTHGLGYERLRQPSFQGVRDDLSPEDLA